MEKKKKSFLNRFPFSLKPDLSQFEPATDEEKRQQERMTESSSFFRDGIKRLSRNPVSMVCLVIIVVITLIAFIVPLFYPYVYQETTVGDSNSSGFLSPFDYSIKESVLRVNSDDVVFMGWSYVNDKTLEYNSYGGLRVIDSEEYLNEVKKYFVTGPISFESKSIELFAVWGIDLDHNGVADYGASLFNTSSHTASRANRYSITYNINGGNGETPVDNTEYASSDRAVPINGSNITFTKDGHVFIGWSKEPNPSVMTSSNYVEEQKKLVTSISDFDGDVTLYAVWGLDSNRDGSPDGFEVNLRYSSARVKRYRIVYNLNMGEGRAPVDENTYASGDSIVPIDGKTLNVKKAYQKVFPHILGTDKYGRDYAIRIIVGTRVSLLVGIIAAIMVVLIGVIYGAISGYFGGRVDLIMMRFVDIIYSLPDTLIIILFSVSIGDVIKQSAFAQTASKLGGTGMISILIVFAMLYWVGMARLVRGQVLSLREQEYVLASQAIGAKPMRIIFKHMLPNCISVIFISAALQIPSAIFTESTLSFLGVGVSEPMPSLGSLASDGRGFMSIDGQRFLFIIPAVVIFLIVLSLNLLGQGLRDAFDPKLRVKGGIK